MMTLREELTESDLIAVLSNISPEDAAEINAAGITDVMADFSRGMYESAVTGCVVLGDTPVAIFGCMPDANNEGTGIPWMVATPAFRHHKRRAMTLSEQVICRMRTAYPYLHNWVHAEHATAIRWLSWLGFSIGEEPVGPGGQFLHFEWSKANV